MAPLASAGTGPPNDVIVPVACPRRRALDVSVSGGRRFWAACGPPCKPATSPAAGSANSARGKGVESAQGKAEMLLHATPYVLDTDQRSLLP